MGEHCIAAAEFHEQIRAPRRSFGILCLQGSHLGQVSGGKEELDLACSHPSAQIFEHAGRFLGGSDRVRKHGKVAAIQIDSERPWHGNKGKERLNSRVHDRGWLANRGAPEPLSCLTLSVEGGAR